MEKISILAKALEDAGIDAFFVETVKNNVVAKGFRVGYPGTGDDIFYPVVYLLNDLVMGQISPAVALQYFHISR